MIKEQTGNQGRLEINCSEQQSTRKRPYCIRSWGELGQGHQLFLVSSLKVVEAKNNQRKERDQRADFELVVVFDQEGKAW